MDEKVQAALNAIDSTKGIYLLIFQRQQTITQSINVGRLGACQLMPGYYLYVGSAFGPGGLRARVNHHLNIQTRRHWHLDYIKPYLQFLALAIATNRRELECEWARSLMEIPACQPLLSGLGSSDCQCLTHFTFLPTYLPSKLQYEELLQRLSLDLEDIQVVHQ